MVDTREQLIKQHNQKARILIEVLSARELLDVDLLNKSDPFCVVSLVQPNKSEYKNIYNFYLLDVSL